MDRDTLRKVQMIQLEIAKEIKCICSKHGLSFFLTAGSTIGAVRHQGFIPWDDDLDIGMLRADYDRFCEIAQNELNSQYWLQTWHFDPDHAIPFGKVRKKNTLFIEGKGKRSDKNGIYIDIIPYDYAPEAQDEQKKLTRRLNDLERMILTKCDYKPWYENGKTIWKKRIGYILYQMAGWMRSKNDLVSEYEKIVRSVPKSTMVYSQLGERRLYVFEKKLFENTINVKYEDTEMPIIAGYHEYLTDAYGDYMKLPPEDQRENRHQIVEVKF